MTLIDLMNILCDNHTITVSHSVVSINGQTIGNCYIEDDGQMVFDLSLSDKSESFDLDLIYEEGMTSEQMVHICLHSLKDDLEDKGMF